MHLLNKSLFIILYVIIILKKLVNATLNSTSRRVLGCGPGPFTIDEDLIGLGQGSLIECCKNHDLCYDDCKLTQIECDDNFADCLRKKCNELKSFKSRIFCRIDASNMIKLVRKLGFITYCLQPNG
ncbi:unnamed protein product [Brachionus calyciflorus]|uniref:Uncharacterized protein n=1 Tax=Brachionus calyciflorus TaxID=104777 RepID=A0A813X6R3_9BILA|nr:unnamed protein product [Brachionus calyciflorus]